MRAGLRKDGTITGAWNFRPYIPEGVKIELMVDLACGMKPP